MDGSAIAAQGEMLQSLWPTPDNPGSHIGQSDLISQKEALPPALRNRLIQLAAFFQNPEFYKAQAMRLSTFDKPPGIIACAEDYPQHFGLPRGCLEDLLQNPVGLEHQASGPHDQRNSGQPLKVTFQGELRPEQTVAAPGHACPRHGSTGRHDCVRQDRGGRGG